MANAVQWSVDQFWGQLQSVRSQLDAATAALNADKAKLQAAYTAARQRNDPMRDIVLAPLIHNNTALRVSYLNPAKAKFMEAVNAASGALKQAGITTPTLSGLGVVPALVLVPVVAVTILGVCVAATLIVNRMTAAQVNDSNAALAIFSNPGTTAAQKLALADAQKAALAARAKADPPPFNMGDLTVPLVLLALILLGPSIMRLLPQRRTAA